MNSNLNEKGNKPEEPGHVNQTSLLFIVNGEPVTINANLNQPLKVAVQDALKDTNSEGRKLEDWLAKYESALIDTDQKVGSFNFVKGTPIFLSLGAGVGG